MQTYIVKDLISARQELQYITHNIILVNAEGTMRYYGFPAIHYIFSKLEEEFIQVKAVQYIFEDDNAAYDTAKKLGII